jgi:hypothetical protein
MNLWRPLALVSTSALIFVVGYQTAFANPSHTASSSVEGDYRRMSRALEHLRSARDDLANSEHNHGGWRERALEATDRAVHETEAAIHWNP